MKEEERRKEKEEKKGRVYTWECPSPECIVYVSTCSHVCMCVGHRLMLGASLSCFLPFCETGLSLTQPGAHSCARLTGWWTARILQGPPPRYWGCRHVMWMLEIQTGPHACYSKCFFTWLGHLSPGPCVCVSLSSKYSCLSILIAGIMHMLYHTLPSPLPPPFFFKSKRKLKHLGVLEPCQTMGP